MLKAKALHISYTNHCIITLKTRRIRLYFPIGLQIGGLGNTAAYINTAHP